ncbi:EscE/YscE/SsaE family type III secretion system needle protein co-chaperone [Caballeronia sp. EK]|uniref:EscE/YscE/SsaE family type III secretion system needle protein co-chaperone n=1 Tax=Caballeronia sp. EK TaxID=2767469 RepID=UPI001654CAF9|nr:EscE/YscE/SsaE family type III secretion system needle protein co-chaperone [Caballeronia sp. EK]
MHTLTELEDRLSADNLGVWRRELRLTLEAAIDEICIRQRQPQQPAAHLLALSRQHLACQAALRVIDIVWNRCHRSGIQFRP